MRSGIELLYQLSEKNERTILGLMSGTSMDGIDVTICRLRGSSTDTQIQVDDFETLQIDESLRKSFRQIAYKENSYIGEVLKFEARLTAEWLRVIHDFLKSNKTRLSGIDLIASHGQTVLHRPDRKTEKHNTLQIVDGDWLASSVGVPVVSDFRQKHIAVGYEGAPLAPLAEVLLFSDPDEERVLLNLGGIANFTLLKSGIEEPKCPFATDTGPANTLLDETIKRLVPGHSYDLNGEIARSGKADDQLLKVLLEHPFFSISPPKSTGQEDFNWEWVNQCLLETSKELEIKDLLATLLELTAITVGEAIRNQTGAESCKVFVSGGGWNNGYLKERLQHQLPGYKLVSSSELGLNPEAKEAALFAVLANEAVAGPGWINADGSRFTLGKISLP